MRVLLPLRAEPVLNGGLRVEDTVLKVEQRAVQCGSEMGNHNALRIN